MNILFLRGFNNYFNRVIKKYSTLADYQSNSTAYVNFASINFNPNDGVVTELVVGNENQKENSSPLDWENIGTPDYCVCYETSGTPAVNTIISRWFVLESERTRSGQYRLALKRDVVAEHFNQIITAPCFVEKGIINDVDNPFLYNKENLTFNQIKKNEILLKDETQSAWIVGYLNNKESADNTIEQSVTLSSSGTASGTYNHASGETIVGITEAYVSAGTGLAHHPEYVTATINSSGNIVWSINWPAFSSLTVQLYIGYQRSIDIELDANDEMEYEGAIDYSDLPWAFHPTDTDIRVLNYIQPADAGYVATLRNSQWRYYNCQPKLYWNNTLSIFKARTIDDVETPWASPDTSVDISNNFNIYTTSYTSIYADYYRTGVYNGFYITNILANQIFTLDGNSYNKTTANITNYNNAVVKYNNKYYKLTITTASANASSLVQINRNTTLYTNYTNIWSTVKDAANAASGVTRWHYHDATGESYKSVNIYYDKYNILAEEVSEAHLIVHFPPSSTRAHLDDGVYDMFCIPYNPVTFCNETLESNSHFSLMTALQLSKYFGSQLYDLQLLPYCPARFFISDTNVIDEQIGTENTDYCYIRRTDNNDIISFILFCTRSSWTFDLNYSITIPTVDSDSVINRKISNECDLYRLTSPNYSGQFEFSVAKNGGSVNKFNVDMTYRPFNPYIHVNPDFSGLYGYDWDDGRGLICGGDFSLPIISDAWTEYQLQNKNYQNIFDRQIQNMDVMNQIGKEQANWQKTAGAIGGIFGGAATGAISGFKMGGGYGAAAGAVIGAGVGGTLGWIGGSKDEEWLRRQQNETKSYTIDMYNYNLGNIQAMPYSLTKSGSLTNNNKLFPFIEYYSCTDAEKEALKQILKYDGMTIMKIDTINHYLPVSSNVMIKGRLIKIENLNDDFHIADAIYSELEKGVYLTPGMEE